ncbi:hypothetical protein M378DRAFT_168385 [Amanita muscaria Koide BX008]|uniref:Uncharacterized protein n=1 Tax=Amanita muscaria (strain Koide BX008) TaxID=946122 RepID=A0A0C2WU04_AMAMK|nr:hypothetical protein M378DRAFT_168385 [Amanita muscaria Koide BX008]
MPVHLGNILCLYSTTRVSQLPHQNCRRRKYEPTDRLSTRKTQDHKHPVFFGRIHRDRLHPTDPGSHANDAIVYLRVLQCQGAKHSL